ncbi:MAG: hypothetical protein GQ534_02715, partial [Candidatus Delongbacteria bacterium]|nr:hypothetical protein [Candidatus Delongbacteria bacterium]
VPVKEKDYYALSSVQERMYILQQMNLESTAFNLAQYFGIGTYTKEAIQIALKILISRHESFRTSFEIVDDIPVQRINSNIDIDVEKHEVSSIEELEDIYSSFIKPFDLCKAPLLRVGYVRNTASNENYLMVDMHHIISDGISMDLLQKEFSKLLQGENLPDLRLQYKDYAEWEKMIINDKQSEIVEFYKHYFQNITENIELPFDYTMDNLKNKSTSCVKVYFNNNMKNKIIVFSKKYQSSLFISLLIPFNLMIKKITGSNQIQTAFAGGARVHNDLSNVIGIFANTLIANTYIDVKSNFSEYFKEESKKTMQLLEYQYYPLEKIFTKMGIKYPDVPVFFNMLNIEDTVNYDIENLESEFIKEAEVSKYPLHIYIKKYNNCLEFNCCYYNELFEKDTIIEIMNKYSKIVENMISNNYDSIKDILKLKKIKIMLAFKSHD